jgi:hypothetical protein
MGFNIVNFMSKFYYHLRLAYSRLLLSFYNFNVIEFLLLSSNVELFQMIHDFYP